MEVFLKKLAIQGIILWAEGEKLRYQAPKQMITPALLAKLKEDKSVILPFIRENGYYAPISYGQQALWFVSQSDPESTAYNIPMPLRLHLQSPEERLDSAKLRRCIQALVNRHAMLRTVFTDHAGRPIQKILSRQTLDWEEIDASGWSWDRVMTEVNARNQRPFDLEAGPLLRVSLFNNRTDVSLAYPPVLFLCLHHIICDDWSTQVLADELRTLYLQKESMILPPVERQYTDYIHWQTELLTKEGQKLATYWQQQLAGELSILNLPIDHPRPPVLQQRGASHSFALTPTLSQQLRTLARAEGVTLYTLLLAAFQVLLHRYTGQDDILTGSPTSAGRHQPEFTGTVGYFVNPIVLRTTLSQYKDNAPGFREFLVQVRQRVLQGLAHQDYPFPLLVQQLDPAREPSRSVLFQTLFVFQNLHYRSHIAYDQSTFQLEGVEIRQMEGQFDLILTMEDDTTAKAPLLGTFKYHTDLFEQKTIARMADHWQTLLMGIVDQPTASIVTLPLLPQREYHQIMVTWNDSACAYPDDQCFHQLFESQAGRTPEAIAAVFVEENHHPMMPTIERMTYKELNRRANQVAHYLQSQGVGSEVVVGLYAERSLEMIIGLLGIFKAGGTYLPLDPAYPAERLAFMMQDAQVSVVLTQARFLTHLPEAAHGARIVALDQDWPLIAQQNEQNSAAQVTPEQLAYLIYTSGSTGQPKGVLVEHRGLSNLATAQIRAFGVVPESRVLQVASFNFDASISEIAMALGAGASLYLASADSLMPGPPLTQLLQTQAITHVTLTPAALAMMSPDALPELQTLIVAGEACSADLVKQWASSRRFFNAYGPTENSVCATIMECTGTIYADGHRSPPIGRPMDNVQVYILDRHLQPTPIGVPGEIHIGGIGLARGYLNHPELTKKKFIPNPFTQEGLRSTVENKSKAKDKQEPAIHNPQYTMRLYKTGDLARYLPDGNIDFLGRIDKQVKVRGYRIELGEIETQLKGHPGVQNAVVIIRGEETSKQLVAYWVANQSQETTEVDLRCYLTNILPSYMIPSFFVSLEFIPMTPNGKVDHRALPAPGTDLKGANFVPPRNPLEAQLVEIWEELLNVQPIGIRDDFFDLGGHSLLTVRLMSRIEQQLGKTPPLMSLFQESTIEKMASILGQETDSDSESWSPLVPLQLGLSGPPFFCIHPVGGHVICYRNLARHLGSDQPFYGLQAPGLNGEQEILAQIEVMAARYIEAIKAIQPQGPYYLGGWSLGGLIAFEMAQQWHAQGESVALLALIESYPYAHEQWHSDLVEQADETTLLSYFINDMTGLSGGTRPSTGNDRQPIGLDERSAQNLEQAILAGILPTDIERQQIDCLWQIFKANFQAMSQYTPEPYLGRIVLFRACEYQTDESDGWQKLAIGGLERHWIPGDHYTIIQEPQVQILAERLREYL